MGTARTDLPTTRAEWQARADALGFRHQAFIDGKWCDAASGKTFAAQSPIDGRVLTQVAECEAVDIDRAVRAARAAFDRGAWANASPVQRKKKLQKLARLVEQHAVELALLETLDMGKPIEDSLKVDVAATIRCLDWTAEAIDKVFDQIAPTGQDELGLITHEPLGVVAAIVPWNFPLLMAAWKIAPALATGTSVLLKPSEKSPLSALRLAELVAEAGIPEGVFNVLPGFGPGCGEAMAMHMDIDGLVFTGSTAVGKHLMVCAGRSNMKRAYMECGGKSPNIVFADAPDLKAAAIAAASGIFYNQGEVCTAASRLLVERSIKDEFLAMVVEAGRGMQPRHPLEPGAPMGAMVDQVQMERVLGFIARGREEGAKLALGGERVLQETGGFYIQPTVFDDVAPGMSISREEIFGPVLSAISVEGEDEAVRIANDPS
jgi:gamma-glutamyl-gamma-aminobutyraldehyde dehydrogenase